MDAGARATQEAKAEAVLRSMLVPTLPRGDAYDEIMGHKIDYIHKNPVKRAYVDEAEHWRYSSAPNYAGQERLLEVCRQ